MDYVRRKGSHNTSKSEAAAVTEFPFDYGEYNEYYDENAIEYKLFDFAGGGDFIITSFDEFQYFTNIDGSKFSFRGFKGLTKITLPNHIQQIPDECFCRCMSLNSIVISNSVKKICTQAFYECSSLTSLNIPSSVVSIGYEAFGRCNNLMALYCEALTPPTLESNLGIEQDAPTTIYVPRSSVEAYKSADDWKEYADRIVGYDF